MDRSDERLKELMKTLADSIGQAFSENDEIKDTLAMIEKEGYHVDMILASVTRLTRKGAVKSSDAEGGISNFDRSFLKRVRIRFDRDE